MALGDAHPVAVRPQVQDCIEACTELVRVSETCAEACLGAGAGVAATECFLADLDCAEVCSTAERMLGWRFNTDGPTTGAVLRACIAAATTSMRACQRMAALHTPWRSCEPAARRTLTSCTALLASL